MNNYRSGLRLGISFSRELSRALGGIERIAESMAMLATWNFHFPHFLTFSLAIVCMTSSGGVPNSSVMIEN